MVTSPARLVRRARASAVLALLGALVAVGALGVGLAGGTPAVAAPVHRQVVVVSVPSASATVGTLEGWAWRDGRWRRVIGPLRAFVGSAGVGAASEYLSRTPAGIHTLTEAFGSAANPGTALPYRKIGWSAWWVSDVQSQHYNTMQFCRPGTCSFGAAEHLRAIPVYTHAVVMDYNRDPVLPGRGSAFFLHVTDGRPTAGCVAISRQGLVQVMRWLRPGAQPVMSVGVGSAAYLQAGVR